MSSMQENFPNLYGFFGCYFHQDWDLDDPNAEAVINRYRRDASSDVEVQGVLDDLERFLGLQLTEEQRKKILWHDLRCNYDPSADGLSCSEWFDWVKTKLRGK